jgi:hypothetical protein
VQVLVSFFFLAYGGFVVMTHNTLYPPILLFCGNELKFIYAQFMVDLSRFSNEQFFKKN